MCKRFKECSYSLQTSTGVVAVHADSKCSGSPPTLDGKPCASTTNYADGHKGACGCGPEGDDTQVRNICNYNREISVIISHTIHSTVEVLAMFTLESLTCF